MQATYTVRRSPLTILVVLATLLAALIAGGVGGYLVKGLESSSLTTTAAVPAAHSSEVPFVGRPPYVYEQGGRPLNVYAQDERTPSIYQQGGRPQVVYDQTPAKP
jgi:hypothetical protein